VLATLLEACILLIKASLALLLIQGNALLLQRVGPVGASLLVSPMLLLAPLLLQLD
jgi:hypothetical protein